MKVKHITFSITSSALTILMLASSPFVVFAADPSTDYKAVAVAANGFGDEKNTTSMLFGKASLRVLTSNSEGVQLWRAVDRMASEWEQVSGALVTTDATHTDVVEVVGFKRFVYAVLNSENGFEVWRWSRTTAWENVYEQHDEGTRATVLMVMPGGRLYLGVASDDEGQAQLYRTSNGKNWQAYGSAGLGNDISSVTKLLGQGDTLIAGTEEGKILRKERNTEWEVVYNGTEPITALQSYRAQQMMLAGVEGENGAMILKSMDDGMTWADIGISPGFGDTDNTRITHFSGPRAPHGMIRAFTQNTVDGFQVWETERNDDLMTWTLYSDASDLGAANTATSKIMRYKGKLFGSTINEDDGTVVYRLEKVKE